MFDHLQNLWEPAGSDFDASAALEQRVLDLLGDTSSNPQGQRVRHLVHERFEALRADAAPALAGAAPESARRAYAEPGSPTDRTNRLQSICERTEARLRAAEAAIRCLADEATRLKRHTDALEARLTAAEPTRVVHGPGDTT